MKLGFAYWMDLAAAGFGDAAARTHAEAIAYLSDPGRPPAADLADLSFPKRMLRTFAYSDDYERGATECVERGAWADDGDRYRLVWHAEEVQRSVAAYQAKLRRDASAQAAARSRGAQALKALIKSGQGECAICSSKVSLQVDHITPRSQGGSNEPENLQVLCRSCNSSKRDRDWDDWRGARGA